MLTAPFPRALVTTSILIGLAACGKSEATSVAGGAPATTASAAANSSPTSAAHPEADMDTRCAPVLAAMHAAEKPGHTEDPLDVLEKVRKNPPKMPGNDFETCAAYTEKTLRDIMDKKLRAEANRTLKAMARGMTEAFEKTQHLCPATKQPVPTGDAAGLAEKPYVWTAAEAKAPTWTCMKYDGSMEPQRFQYEVRTDPAGKWFEIVARGAPRRDGHVVEIVDRGDVDGKSIKLSRPSGDAPAAK